MTWLDATVAGLSMAAAGFLVGYGTWAAALHCLLMRRRKRNALVSEAEVARSRDEALALDFGKKPTR